MKAAIVKCCWQVFYFYPEPGIYLSALSKCGCCLQGSREAQSALLAGETPLSPLSGVVQKHFESVNWSMLTALVSVFIWVCISRYVCVPVEGRGQ